MILQEANDGTGPGAGVVVGPDGSFYGTTVAGGGGSGCAGNGGCGTVFKLTSSGGTWSETVLYRFSGGIDGDFPKSQVVFDQAGNLYGTTQFGGIGPCKAAYPGVDVGCGVIYKLAPSSGTWVQSVLYSFTGGSDGGNPVASLIFDTSGNLYGTTDLGGTSGYGTVFKLTPSGSSWNESVLYSFQNGSDGAYPLGGLIIDPSGNLYGTTSYTQTTGGGGTVFELTPSNVSETFFLLHTFGGGAPGPNESLVMHAGNLYGASCCSIFKLTPSNRSWVYSSLHDFTGYSDGSSGSGLVFDASGNSYGTSNAGISPSKLPAGIIFQITP